LGAVGDGAHAAHEQIELSRLVERAALLALLLMAPFTAKDLPNQTVRSPGGAPS
jgi:hypothetical protein